MADYHEPGDVTVTKRSENIADVVMQMREPVTKLFMELWSKIYKDEKIPKTKWLQQFQLSLKRVKELDDEEIAKRLSHKKRLLSNVYAAIMLTAYIHHNHAEPHINKERPLVIRFAYDCIVQVARELWSKPYMLFNITHKKNEVESAKDAMDKLIATTIKYQVRNFTEDVMIAEEERIAKCKELMALEASDTEDDVASSISSQSSKHSKPSKPSKPPSYHSMPLRADVLEQHECAARSRSPSVASMPLSVKSARSLEEYVPEIASPRRSDPNMKTINILSVNKYPVTPDNSLPASPKSIMSAPPRQASIDHMDYIPLKRGADSASIVSKASATAKRKHDTKLIDIGSVAPNRKGVYSPPSSIYSSLSSSSSYSSVSTNKKINNKPVLTALEKYSNYRRHTAMAPIASQKKKKSFF